MARSIIEKKEAAPDGRHRDHKDKWTVEFLPERKSGPDSECPSLLASEMIYRAGF